jgi:hypothetical protein
MVGGRAHSECDLLQGKTEEEKERDKLSEKIELNRMVIIFSIS